MAQALSDNQITGFIIGYCLFLWCAVISNFVLLFLEARQRSHAEDAEKAEKFSEELWTEIQEAPPPTHYEPWPFKTLTLFNSSDKSRIPYWASASTPSTYVPSPSPATPPHQCAQSLYSSPEQTLAQVDTNSGAPTSLPKPITTEEILGTDKRSQLRDVQAEASRYPQDLAIALGRTAFQSDKPGAIDRTRAVDPWEIEEQPNPVHFPHLYLGASSSTANERLKNSVRESCSCSGELGGKIGADPNENMDIESMDFEMLADAVCDSLYPELSRNNSLTRSSRPVSTISPSIRMSWDTDITDPDTPMTVRPSLACDSPGKGSHQIIAEKNQVPEQHDHDVSLEGLFNLDETSNQQTKQDMNLQIHAVSIPYYPVATNKIKSNQPTPAKQTLPLPKFSTPSLSPSSSTSQKAPIGPQLPLTTTNPTPPSFPCPHCSLPLSTQGKLNDHVNRKHTRRFHCPHCAEKFHLRADLTRHKITVHREQHAPEKTYRCPNEGCGKEWGRKDHAKRHAGRCKVGKRAEGG